MSLRAVASARALKPMITAPEASARLTSDSVMPPTPAWTTLTFTSSVASGRVGAALNADAVGRASVRGFQSSPLRLQQDLSQQRIDALAGLGRNGHARRIPAEVFRHHAIGEQVLPDFFRIGLVLVDLVD